LEKSEIITTLHGAGGIESWEIIERLIRRRTPSSLWKTLGGAGLDVLDDGSYITLGDKYIVFTSDSYTVKPLFFPGGNIGELAVSGVLNDLVMMGARPVAFMDNIIVEEGFPMRDLEVVVDSMIKVLVENNIPLIGGDFKVMPRGEVDGVVISGFAIGVTSKPPVVDAVKPGDKIIVTNYIAEHGATILAAQLGMLNDASGLRSDARPLVKTVLPVIEKYRDHINAARDPTRGGLATLLNEWVRGTGLTIVIDKSRIPIRSEVSEFLEMLGIDPLTLASEGVAVLSVRSEVAERVVEELRANGENPSIIGEVVEPWSEGLADRVVAVTEVGGMHVVSPTAYNLPRIC